MDLPRRRLGWSLISTSGFLLIINEHTSGMSVLAIGSFVTTTGHVVLAYFPCRIIFSANIRDTNELELTPSTHHDSAANDAPCDGVEIRTAYFLRLLGGRVLLHGEARQAGRIRMRLSRRTIRTTTT